MALSCSVKVYAKNGKESRLFKDLLSHTKDRELSKQMWSVTQVPELLANLEGLEYDSNGEVTYDSFSKAINLVDLFDKHLTAMEIATQLGISDTNGNPHFFDKVADAMDKAIEYNERDLGYVASVELSEDKPVVKIDAKTALNAESPKQLLFHRDLNNRLLNTLRSMGFDVTFMNDPHKEGVFNPMLAEENAGRLKTVIGISKGEIGENAFPEEFAHLIIAGLHDNALVERLKNFVSPELAEAVLGDSYEAYREEYKDATDVDAYLQEEAMGKMLADAIVYGNAESPLLGRIWERAKQLFARGDTRYIDDQIEAAKQVLNDLVEVVNNPEELEPLLDKKYILSHRELDKLSSQLKTSRDMALEGEQLLAKRIQMYKLENNWDDSTRERRKEDLETMDELRLEIANKQYEAACYRILDDALRQLIRLNQDAERLSDFSDTNNPSIRQLDAVAGQLNKIQQFNDAYEPLIEAMVSIELLAQRGEVILSEDSIKQIQDLAMQVRSLQAIVKDSTKRLRYDVIKNWIGMNYSPIELNSVAGNPVAALSIDAICQRAERDITILGRNVSSLGDSGNPLLNILHAIVVSQQSKRNNIVNEYYSYLQADEAELKAAGHTNEFIFEYGEDGIPTGRFVSPHDFKKYEEARKAEIERIANDPAVQDDAVAAAYLRIWENDNLEWYVVDEESDRKERLPRLDRYENKDFQKGWDKAQIDYYNEMIALKARLDTMLPTPAQNVYHAPQMDKTVLDILDPTDPKGSLKNLWLKIKNHYVGDNEITRSGENPNQLEEEGQLHIVEGEGEDEKKYEFSKSSFLDFAGNPVKSIPVYYVRDLDDMSLMLTDATRAMMAYTAMAVNYQQMNEIADLALLLKQYVKQDYVVAKRKAGAEIFEKFNVADKDYTQKYEVKGENSKIYEALSDFLESNLFGGAHEDMMVLKNGLKTHALFEDFRSYVSKNALGFNLFSGLSNVTMGEAQMLTEAAGGFHFNMKDLLWAHKEYNKLLPEYLADMGKEQKRSKLGLICRAFNVDEEFFRSVQEDVYNRNAFMRVVGKFNSLFLQTAGENMLHLVGALAILHHIKTNNGTLYDALQKKEINGAVQLFIKDNTTIDMTDKNNQNKNWIKDVSVGHDGFYHVGEDDLVNMNTLINNVSVYVNRVNAGLHGGYSQTEKGQMNRKALWRLVTQFRQWMPGTYNELYHGEYYDAVYGFTRTGAYNAAVKFMKNLALDIKRGQISLALNWDRLNDYEKAQCKKVLFQASLFLTTTASAVLARGMSGKDRPWAEKMLRYQIERLRLETGALTPNLQMLKSFTDILQSPMAGIDGVNNIINALSFWNAADEIESGRYAGWSRWERDLFKAIPYHNIVKAMDMRNDNYMFRMFDSKN